MIQNSFDHWNEKKKITHKNEYSPAFRVREIWWTQLGKNIASESLGKGEDFLRPVLILQKFYGTSALVIPLTTQGKKGNYYFSFQNIQGGTHTALLPQVRYIDGKRLRHKLSKVDTETFSKIQEQLFKLIKNYPQSRKQDGGS